ncbi:ATP-dependent DNA ligase [Microbacterium thalassium]|uniref:DNA ligase (ATP) n=1 Tax=Microbacterium thalassium TaxID=362649 RepID=A0A7X0FRA4_9MICO|nr:ATP-dependent DNA ligase [Microbacterium thalassium]MBB6392255.1 bifunctional non-homologous end joining protein LigD [Microbacterium thalassium]GLK23466.1 ATP-dependent DNA ligase [Microbacterium thalassium]
MRQDGRPPAASSPQTVRIDGRRLRLTNLDKVLYPATGTTKGEVIDYVTRIAPVMIPHLIGRPVTRKRWPDGVEAPSFFAKDLEAGAPSWVRRMPIPHSTGTKDYPLVGDVPTLVYLAQAASLELHVPQWRFAPDGTPGRPDRLVLDLDPGPGTTLADCAEVARWAREILQGMGLEPLPVTSGSKGIHLYAPLPQSQTSDEVSMVARELARAIEADHPELVVSQMAKAERGGKVFIDWSQNNAAKTTIAPYSLRGRTKPWVAGPRTWDELADPDLRQLLFHEVLDRVAASGDPLAPLGFHAGARAAAHGPLAAYIAKRDGARTPEPVPANALGASASVGEKPRFVIQEHHASRLHWDLRLERDGVLVSWAVPRGIPHTTTRNNLAVQTEDHPMEYADFEGTIPRGEYGAGTMTIWDDGRYDLEKWRDDEIIFTLEGRPGGPLGRVRLVLIRTDGAGEKSTWLLHRMKTDAAGRPQPDGTPVEASDQADDDPHAPAAARIAPETADSPRTAGPERGSPQESRVSTTEAAAGTTVTVPPPSELRPMLATAATPGIAREAARRWAGDDGHPWAEVKWDGVRAIGAWDGRTLTLRARSGNDITAKYPELTDTDPGWGPSPVVVDGEIVALDERGRPSFPLLQNRMNLSRPEEIRREAPRTPVRYHLFDLLSVDGRDAASLPLAQRRELLESIAAASEGPIDVPPVFDDTDEALAMSERFGLEGIVVKDPGSTYRRGERSDRWLKVKLTRTQEVVIGGIRPGKGGRSGSIGSLLVGIPSVDGLRYAGRVGSGFSDAARARLERLLTPLRTDEAPFIDVPAADASDALWVRPDVVGEVEFAEFTPGGILRQARWRGIRPDKAPEDVTPEA